LYEIAKKLPYELNKEEFERKYDLLKQNLTINQLDYFEKLYNKKTLWSRAYNKEDSFNAHCTGMVENINRQLKEHVSIKCSLVEYIYRAIHFTIKFNKEDNITKEELLQYNVYYDLVKSSPYLLRTQNLLSEFSLKKLVINMMKSMSWVPDSEDIFLLKRADNQDIQIKLTEQLDLLVCSCGFFVAMQFPCEHILRILTQKRKEEDVIKYFNQRWFKSGEPRSSDELLNELDRLIKENRKPDPSQNEEVKGEIEEEKLEQNPFENEESEDTL